MKLTAQVKLLPSAEQAIALRETLERANAACNSISEWGWSHHVLGQWPLHKALYYDIRGQFSLTAQLAVRCIAKVLTPTSWTTGPRVPSGPRAVSPTMTVSS